MYLNPNDLVETFFIHVTENHRKLGSRNDSSNNMLCLALRDAGIPTLTVHHAIIFDNPRTDAESLFIELPDDIKQLNVDWHNHEYVPDFGFYIAFINKKPRIITHAKFFNSNEVIVIEPYKEKSDVSTKRFLPH